jgi:hypothetical protein
MSHTKLHREISSCRILGAEDGDGNVNCHVKK